MTEEGVRIAPRGSFRDAAGGEAGCCGRFEKEKLVVISSNCHIEWYCLTTTCFHYHSNVKRWLVLIRIWKNEIVRCIKFRFLKYQVINTEYSCMVTIKTFPVLVGVYLQDQD